MIAETDLDEDIKQTAHACFEQIRLAFTLSGLSNNWSHAVGNYLQDSNLTPIRMTSGYVRVAYGYNVPDDAELEQVCADIQQLIDWLNSIDLLERDFIRRSLIEGLEGFLFRVQRVGCFGWPDSFESLKAVITAYMALERGAPAANESPPYEAVLKKTAEFLQSVFDRVKFAKDVTEVGDWLLKGYVALQVVGHAQPAIAGLLTHATP